MQLNFACVCPGTGEERAKPRPPRSHREKTFRADGRFLQKLSFFENLWLTKPPPCGIITNVAGNETPARHMKCAAVAHLVERHLAKVEVASSSLVGRSKKQQEIISRFSAHMVTWPSGKAKVCKTLIRQFKSARHLHKTVMK